MTRLPSTDEERPNSPTLLIVAVVLLAIGFGYFGFELYSSARDTAEARNNANEFVDSFEDNMVLEDVLGSPEPPASIPYSNDSPVAPRTSSPQSSIAPSSTGLTTTSLPSIDPQETAVVFINRVPGEDYGKVGYLDSSGDRKLADLDCSRIDANQYGGICLSATAGLGGSGRGYLLDASLRPGLRFGVNRPSRAAISPEGTVVAWTGFSLGHSYLNAGEFATTTQLISVDRFVGVNLESDFGIAPGLVDVRF